MENLADIATEPENPPSYLFYNAGWVYKTFCLEVLFIELGRVT